MTFHSSFFCACLQPENESLPAIPLVQNLYLLVFACICLCTFFLLHFLLSTPSGLANFALSKRKGMSRPAVGQAVLKTLTHYIYILTRVSAEGIMRKRAKVQGKAHKKNKKSYDSKQEICSTVCKRLNCEPQRESTESVNPS